MEIRVRRHEIAACLKVRTFKTPMAANEKQAGVAVRHSPSAPGPRRVFIDLTRTGVPHLEHIRVREPRLSV